jgi:SAM-dependent methyltransferase
MEITIPLTFEEMATEIVKFTNLPRKEVEQRLWMEAFEPGWNGHQDAVRFQITPHTYDSNMLRLYNEGDGFIFETLVFWVRLRRRLWSQHALERIERYATRHNLESDVVKILIFGDGTGNDSLYLIKNGFKVDYFDVPGSKTFDFAMKRFEYYGLLGEDVTIITNYDACFSQQYDVIISFEVLEHLPKPLDTIRDIHSMLKTRGIALITESFGGVEDEWPTHLESNLKYHGTTPFLFFKNKMLLTWYSKKPFFRPMELTKVSKTSRRDFIHLLCSTRVTGRYIFVRLLRLNRLARK